MRTLLPALLLSGLAMTARADTYVYVSQASEQTIWVAKLNTKDGTLTEVQKVAVDGAPGSLTVDPKKKTLYVSLRTNSTLASFRVDSATGMLKHLNTAALPENENAAYVKTDPSGRWLVSASYAAGKVVVHALGEDGALRSPPVPFGSDS